VGSSIFRGDGQVPDELWSVKLQQLLGEKYKVINFASDGTSFPSCGGVVFRMLRQKHPKIIFVAAAYQFNAEGKMDSIPPYNYFFWDAYYKRLFHPYTKEVILINDLRKSEMSNPEGLELHLMSILDSYFYFRNLWNWLSYRLVFTVFSEYEFKSPYLPRVVVPMRC